MVVGQRERFLTFGALWAAYCLAYFLRKPLGILKIELEGILHLSKSELGMMDFALLFPYSTFQIFASSYWDRLPPKKTLIISLATASIAMITLGLWKSYSMICLCLFVNGMAQAPLYPIITKLLSKFGEEKTALVFGAFGTAPYVGAVGGTVLAAYMQNYYGWEWIYLPVGLLGVIVNLLLFLILRNDDQEKEVKAPVKPSYDFLQLWDLPGVPAITVAAFCLKFVRYGLYMWLPIFMIHFHDYSMVKAASFSLAFDLGCGSGGVALGLIIDRFYAKKPLWVIYNVVFLGVLAFLLFLFTGSSLGIFGSFFFLFLVGVANGGPDSFLAGSVSVGIGETFTSGGGAGAGVTSLINGLASGGGILEGPLLGYISSVFGWPALIVTMILLTFVATLAILRAHLILRVAAKKRQILIS